MYFFSIFLLVLSACRLLVANAVPIALGAHYQRESESELARRTRRIPVGPGGRFPQDDPSDPSYKKTSYKPIPKGKYVETHGYVYSYKDINAQADIFLDALSKAVTTSSSNKKKSIKTYPKPSSGFRLSEKERDPTIKHEIKYHYPMKGKPGNVPIDPRTRKPSIEGVGPDRLLAYRHANKSKFNIGISFHDPARAIPANSFNHPFSHAAVKDGGPIKVGFLKAKKAIQRGWRKVKKLYRDWRGAISKTPHGQPRTRAGGSTSKKLKNV